MNADDMQWVRLAAAHLPIGAELAEICCPSPHYAVVVADLNGDGCPEVAAVYRLHNEYFVMILQHCQLGWVVAACAKGMGYGVTVMTAAPVTNCLCCNLIIGWQVGAIWSTLSVYAYSNFKLCPVLPDGINFSYLDVEDMPGPHGRDGQAELALWAHDTGEAYDVHVMRWSKGMLVPAPDVYPYYFCKVVHYYERMVAEHPDYGFYWFHLADAQFKACQLQAALASVDKALSFPQPYPSLEVLKQLKHAILASSRGELGIEAPWPAVGITADIDGFAGVGAVGTMLEAASPVGVDYNVEATFDAEDRENERRVVLLPAAVKTTSGTKWGYIDAKGSFVIAPQFSSADAFQPNGLAVVQLGNHSGLIDMSGAFRIRPIYDFIGPFTEGRAVVIDSAGFKIIDERGNVLTTKAYSYISAFSDERAMFYVMNEADSSSKYGYLDRKGTEVIPAQFESAGDFAKGKAVVKLHDQAFALIDRSGRKLAEYPFYDVGQLGEGLLSYQPEQNGKYGYMNERGQSVIYPAFTAAMPFQDGRAIVNTAEDFRALYGVIDKRGGYVVQPAYNDIRQLGEQRLALGKARNADQPYLGSLYAIADQDGKLLTDYLFTDVADYKYGLASVTDGKQTYFINTKGQPAQGYPRLSGRGVLTIMDGVVQAVVDNRESYYTRSGRLIWQSNTIIPLRVPLRVKEHKYKPNVDYLVYYPSVEGMVNQAAQQQVNRKLEELSQVKPIPANVQLEYSYDGDFDVTWFHKNLLVLQLNGYNFPFGAAHGMPTMIYSHINVIDGSMYELRDLFLPGSNYVKVLSDIVGEQIKTDPQYSYVFPDTYMGIKPDQPFYVTEDALHLYFNPYDIAPFAAGFPTFRIPYAQISSIIATEGAFWRSFH
ncbi:hypothetical protein BBD42_24240 [Paenibacillus sp. BIHB 4019]|uniref:DUF3298 domain-containing protein n=2 Tax=Paenibacillus sp. BIHB 4019 TaxID=1870819 RepID=A0A1B2DTD3_9BACL|nr:hypothetical protein BBD42_24240 [Paenibacillus sp. BIHB 4019]